MYNVKLKLAPPWVTYVNKIKTLFGNDPDIDIVYDDSEDKELKLYIAGKGYKAEAISRLLPEIKVISNTYIKITIIPANSPSEELDEHISNKNLFDLAFERNPVYAFSEEISDFFSNPLTYVVFKNKVVQFFNDNLNDIHGLISTLYQDIAYEIFEDAYLDGVFYNTDIEEKVGKPLGEWP